MNTMNAPQENLSNRIQEDLHRLDALRNRPDRLRLERTLAALFLVLFIILYSVSPQAALAGLSELNEEDTLGSVINLDDCLEDPTILIEQLTEAGFSQEDIQSVLDNVCAGSTPGNDKLASRTGPAVIWEDPDNTISQEQRRLSLTLHGEVDSSQGLNLRMEPWTDGNRLTILQDHTPFEAVGRDQTGEWLVVLVDGADSSDLGWVFRDNTSLRDSSQVESLTQFDGQTTLPAMITTRFEGGAALRLEPSPTSRQLDRLPSGTRIMLRGRIDQPDGLWYLAEVVEPGQTGEIGFVKAHDGSENLVSQPGGNLIPDTRNDRLPELEGSNPQAAVEVQITNTSTPVATEQPTAIPTNTPRLTPTHEPTATPIPTNTLRPSATPQEVAVATTPTPQEIAAAPEIQPGGEQSVGNSVEAVDNRPVLSTVNWVEIAQTNPDTLNNYQLAPELRQLLENPDYLQLGYVNENGEFVGIPVIFNPAGDEARKQHNASVDHIEKYFVVQTPLTRDFILNVIIPDLVDLYQNHNTIPQEMPSMPQIIVTYGEMDDNTGFVPVYSQRNFRVSRKYDAAANVLHVNVVTTVDFGGWSLDVIGFMHDGITAGFSSDIHTLSANDWMVPLNPLTSRSDAGYGILTTDEELRMSVDYPTIYPVNLTDYGLK